MANEDLVKQPSILDKLKDGKQFLSEAKRLSKFMESIDTDLKNMSTVLNDNFKALSRNFGELDARLKAIEDKLK